jgi:ribosomal protein L37AE/L43A
MNGVGDAGQTEFCPYCGNAATLRRRDDGRLYCDECKTRFRVLRNRA